MKKFFLIFLAICLVPCAAFAATTFNDTTADHKWSTAANWSDGKPDAADAVTVHADVTALIIDEAAVCLSFDTTAATGNVAVSGAGTLAVAGNFTLAAGDTWTGTGAITISADCTLNTAAISIGTIASLTINNSADVTLGSNLNVGTKNIYINGGSSGDRTVFSTSGSNYQIDCGSFGDNNTANYNTITLGSSTINAALISFRVPTNLTLTANTTTVNMTPTAVLIHGYFGTKTWGGTVTITIGDGLAGNVWDANTFANLTVVFNPDNYNGMNVGFDANQTITGTFTITGNTSNTAGGAGNIRGTIMGKTVGTQRTITAATVSMTGACDFRDIKGAGAGSWDLSAVNFGNLGGNADITFRAATTYYAACGDGSPDNSMQDYEDVWSVADDGTADGAGVFPLPQDTIIFNNNTWSDTGNGFAFHANGSTGSVDASALTEANSIMLPRNIYGDVLYTGSGVSISQNPAYTVQGIDARLKNETSASPLIINTGNLDAAVYAVTMYSNAGTVQLAGGFKTSSSFTLTKGTLDLNGQTLTVSSISSSGSLARTLQDSAGGGKIVLNGLTGTLFDTTTATNLTISNAPDIDIGDSNNTLTGNVTFIGSAKTYGDFTVKKHAGNYDCIITGSNTFGALTLETPDATYNYSDIQFTAGTTTTVSSFAAVGTATYPIAINSATASAHTLTDTAGANAVQYCSIAYSQAGGGAAWTASNSTDGGNNTGWGFGRKRIFHVIGN